MAALVMLGFGLATASFVGSTVYANARLESVAQRSHEVSDNAMPSIMHLGRMRRELAHVLFIADELSEGESGDVRELRAHGLAAREARQAYESLRRFPGEIERWQRAGEELDRIDGTIAAVADRLDARDAAAHDQVIHDLGPAVGEVDRRLDGLVRINHERGRLVALQADAAWRLARQLSLLFVAMCAIATGGLACAAYMGFRSHERETQRRYAELEAFASRVAHDIRGPLSTAMLALDRGAHGRRPDEAIQRHAERGLRGLQRIEVLVRDLLSFARSGALPEEDARASLPSVVADVVQDVEAAASAARIDLRVAPLPACEVACASGVLTSVILNLLTNSVNHFPADKEPRSIVVRARADARRVRIEVADTGAGLPSELLSRLFEPYVRGTTHCAGLGLGLATVRRLVEAHGGTAGVVSRVGEGATFWVEMPCAREAV